MASCNIKVMCRFRPMNSREKQETLMQSDWVLKYIEGHTVECSHGKLHHNFTFDSVFDPDSSQEIIYNVTARPCIQDVLEGYNGTIFAYGQSGSGKTFTMFGPEKPFPDDLKGVIPRASEHIFDHIEADEQMSYAIKCSFLEIYKENIRDLLAPSTTTGINKENIYLKIRESPTKGVWVDGLTEEFATCEQDIDDLIALGDNSRSVASTGMNQRSSRSHTMFVIAIEQKAADGSTKTGRLNLIDLAGSEKIAKTGATGETLEEAKKINQSLSALGKCINALTSGKGHIPYRESKLTRILQESLGGNTKTTLIVTCSAHAFNAEETVSTMQFGQRAKTIKNKVQVNKQLSVAELEAELKLIQKEYNACKVYSTKLEKQIAWMRSPDYDASKPIPLDLIATKPVVTSTSVSNTPRNNGKSDREHDIQDGDDSGDTENNGSGGGSGGGSGAIDEDYDSGESYNMSSHSRAMDSDDESEDGSEAIAIAETKLEIQKLRDELEMNEILMKDELSNMQVRLEEKRQQLEGQHADIAKADAALHHLKDELANMRRQFDTEMANSVEERKEKEAKCAELQKEFQKLSEETSKLQATLAESDENFLVLFTENETIRTLLGAQLKELHNTEQSISDLSRSSDKLAQKASSSKAEYEMLGQCISNLENEVTAMAEKKSVLEDNHKSTTAKLSLETSKLAETAQQAAILSSQLSEVQKSILHQKENLQQAEKTLSEINKKYHDTIENLRLKLSIAIQNEASLLEKWKGQSQQLADIQLSLKPNKLPSPSKSFVEPLQNQLQVVRDAIKQSEADVAVARDLYFSLDKSILTLKAASQAAVLEKQQIMKAQGLQTVPSSSGLLDTLFHKLKRLKEEKTHLESELSTMQQEERSLKDQDQDWRTQMLDLESKWKSKELESSKLQNTLTKESTRLTSITALAASQSTTIKQQKEQLTQLKTTLRNTREAANLLQHGFDKLQAKRDDLEKQLAEKEKLRLEAQRNAVEAARLHEQMLQRRRVTNRSSNKKGLLEAFQQKVDIESKRAGLKNTGSLFLQEARDEHYRGFAQEQKTDAIVGANASTTPTDKSLGLSPSSSRSRMALVRRPSFQVSDLGSVRIGGNKLTTAEVSMYEQMFSHYDKDKSGSIDANELKALLAELGRQPSDDVMITLMKELDKDGNGLVEFPEFLHGMDILNGLQASPRSSPRS